MTLASNMKSCGYGDSDSTHLGMEIFVVMKLFFHE